ncbi:hypothetical protein PCASD_17997 [Puccinia coronata f. sp. avenae]|uniref:Uncharacterized protein n=1 Tax=Puccinia coronata f. sp. avenae TaxID=200324 RepID=A0A2N5U6I0_9BASI|nr:hypothetical protein PCASD_17997 [Puccinia coronata f. sp. avenae]
MCHPLLLTVHPILQEAEVPGPVAQSQRTITPSPAPTNDHTLTAVCSVPPLVVVGPTRAMKTRSLSPRVLAALISVALLGHTMAGHDQTDYCSGRYMLDQRPYRKSFRCTGDPRSPSYCPHTIIIDVNPFVCRGCRLTFGQTEELIQGCPVHSPLQQLPTRASRI